jgi:hypothetical protein
MQIKRLSRNLKGSGHVRDLDIDGRPLPLGKGPPVPIVREAGWVSELVWTQRVEEISSASARDRTSLVQSFGTILTELPQLKNENM